MIGSILAILINLASTCGTIGADVEDRSFWSFSSVIYAEVLGTTKSTADHPGDKITLRPISTLTGSFDCAYVGQFTAGTQVGADSAQSMNCPRMARR